ncbi:MAG: hypothetical protein LBS43_05285, partial [Prevotellaceae bacterium]|nr:hypothetical protein [Prevotellaceae bacterium]
MKNLVLIITCIVVLASCSQGKKQADKCEKSSTESCCKKEKSSTEGCCKKEKSSTEGCCKKEKSSTEGCCKKERSSAEGCSQKEKSCCQKDSLNFNNADFYKDGKFNEEAGKDAVLRLMKYYKYPVTCKTRSQLWVSDYGTGRFTEVGLAAIMYANDVKDRYMLQDI